MVSVENFNLAELSEKNVSFLQEELKYRIIIIKKIMLRMNNNKIL
jgi:hypothetical protein